MLLMVSTLHAQGRPAPGFQVIYSFTGGADGAGPWAAPILDAQGNLYGTASSGGTGPCVLDGNPGCGTVYKLAPNNGSWRFTPLYSYGGVNSGDGEYPIRPLVFGPSNIPGGILYGNTPPGGQGTCTFYNATGCGTAFKLYAGPVYPGLRRESVIYRFPDNAENGGQPASELVFDKQGNGYGTAFGGGAFNSGVVFKLTPSGGGFTESVIYSFAGGDDGASPVSGLYLDSKGNLYGTTSGGGSGPCQDPPFFGCGVVYELSPGANGWTETVLYAFQDGDDGKHPNGGVIMDASGDLLGTTWAGGSQNGGTAFQLTPSGNQWSITTFYTFGLNGAPLGTFVMDSAGSIYGTIQQAGAFTFGQVFKFTPSQNGWIFTDLYDFTGGADGANPLGGVAVDSKGNVYGTTWDRGANACKSQAGCGVIYEIVAQ
jgi:hypothetical protein